MGCSGCSSGRGCNTSGQEIPKGCNSNGWCTTGSCNKLNTYNWLSDVQLPENQEPFDVVEVRFKNTRKEFYRNVNKIYLKAGDIVAVGVASGHDIGVVSLTGDLVKFQLKKRNIVYDSPEIKKIYRKAGHNDVQRWEEAIALEEKVMKKAKEIANELELAMKICDVEYQGDKSKATFYYTADDRVDFRELIKKYAGEFKAKIEMRQIGARQEAGRLGGIGVCGRELCCGTWLTDFRSVATSTARYQQLSLNPTKLAGQCGKLKCCLNYELDTYMEELKAFPSTEIKIKTHKGELIHRKSDIFKQIIGYAYKENLSEIFSFSLLSTIEMIQLNKAGKIIDEKEVEKYMLNREQDNKSDTMAIVVGEGDLDRFMNKSKEKRKVENKRGRFKKSGHRKLSDHKGGERKNHSSKG